MNIQNLISSFEENFREYVKILREIENDEEANVSHINGPDTKNFLHELTKIEDEVFEFRLKKILNEEHPYIPQINVDKIKRNIGFFELELSDIIHQFIHQRKELLKILYAIPRNHWDRTGVHEVEGHIEFKEYVRRMAKRDKEILNRFNSMESIN
jgi:hypothetical protein